MRHLIVAGLLAAATPGLAEEAWLQIDYVQHASGQPMSYWVAAAGPRQLQVHCRGTEAAPGLMMVLLGGEATLPAEVEQEQEFPVTVRLAPSDETRAVMASWLGPFDNAVNGGFPSDAAFLDAFEAGGTLTITGPAGGVLIETPLTGANWARFGFGEVCGV